MTDLNEEEFPRPKVTILTRQDAMLEDLLDRCVGLMRECDAAAKANNGQGFAASMKQYQQMMGQAEIQLRVIVSARAQEAE